MPAVLTEIGFFSNQEEKKLLQSADYQSKLAKGITEGIIAFLDE